MADHKSPNLGRSAIAIGAYSNAAEEGAIAIGGVNTASGSNSVALGIFSSAGGANSVALGANSVATDANTVSVGSATQKRRIVNVDAGTAGTDAVNVDQMNAAIAASDQYFMVNSTSSNLANATGANAVAIGQGVTSSGSSSVAIGSGTIADGLHSMALGASSRVVGNSNLAVGDGATVTSLTTAPTNAIAIGKGANVSDAGVAGATGSIAIGTSASAGGTGTIAIGTNTRHSGSGATVVGTNASAMGGGAGVAMGINSAAAGSASVAMGPDATAAGTGSIAIGNKTATANVNAMAIGNSASASGTNGIALGVTSVASGNNGAAIGNAAKAAGSGDIALGFNAVADHKSANLGRSAIAIGAYSNAAEEGAIAIGGVNTASGSNSVALGIFSSAGGANSVALGANSVATADNTVSVGSASLKRKIVNMDAGAVSASSTDAVNGSQLHGVADSVASAIGGGSVVNADGSISAPSFTVGDGSGGTTTVRSVGSAVANLNGRVTTNEGDIASLADQIGNGTVGLVQQSAAGADITVGANTDGAAVDFTGTAGARKLTGVDAGAVSASSTEAVNGSQLHGVSSSVASAIGGGSVVNTDGSISAPSFTIGDGSGGTTTVRSVGGAVTNLDGRVTTNEGAIASLADQIGNGTVGLVQQAGAGADITVGASTDGAAVDFTGTAGARKLTGVDAGAVTASSTDAVNGSQLHGVSSSVASAIGGGSVVNADGSISAPSFTVGDGSGGTTTVRSVGDVVTNLDGRVKTNEDDITSLADQIGSGTLGLVQQSAAGADITVGANTDGAAVDFTGTAGARKLTGVDAGAISAASTDAVNGSQLHGVADSVASAIGGGSVVNADGSISAPSFTVGDGGGGTTTVHSVGDVVTNLDGRVTTNEGAVASLADQIGSGTVGLVQQAGAGANLTVGANTDGTAVSFIGTAGARKLSGVANGVNDDDAVTIAQLKATGLIDYTGKEIAAVTYDDISLASVTFGGSAGTKLLNVAPGLIAAGSMEAVNGGQLHDLQEQFAREYARLDGRVGDLETGGGSGSGGDGGGSVGPGTGGEGSLVVGDGSAASGENSSAIGQGSNASGSNSSAIGQGAVASGDSSTAIGQGSSATGSGSVAIGAGSVATEANTVSFGDGTAEGNRRLVNIADGVNASDAATKGQLDRAINGMQGQINDVAKNAYAGVAAAMAMPNLTPSQPGKTVVAAGAANYKSGSAIAAGATYRTRDGKWLMNGAVSVTSTGDAGVRAQVGYEF
uniref:beta strand repeat-containing protein n=1 Tax=Burkholderia metallica TaxID=488729 RepID=UPI0038516943